MNSQTSLEQTPRFVAIAAILVLSGLLVATAVALPSVADYAATLPAMAEHMVTAGTTVIDGPLVEGPLVNVSDLLNDLQTGQFQQ